MRPEMYGVDTYQSESKRAFSSLFSNRGQLDQLEEKPSMIHKKGLGTSDYETDILGEYSDVAEPSPPKRKRQISNFKHLKFE